jgi:hypothetical protein
MAKNWIIAQSSMFKDTENYWCIKKGDFAKTKPPEYNSIDKK